MRAGHAATDDGKPHEEEKNGDIGVLVVHRADSEEKEERCGRYSDDE